MSAPTESMLSIGVCRICQTGPLGLRVCGACGELAVLCDECDAVWPNEAVEKPPEPLPEGALPCPHCGASLVDKPSHWASREEVNACAWLRSYLEKTATEVTEVTALAPRANPENGSLDA